MTNFSKLFLIISLATGCHQMAAQNYTEWFSFMRIIGQSSDRIRGNQQLENDVCLAIRTLTRAIPALDSETDDAYLTRVRQYTCMCDDAGNTIYDKSTLQARLDELLDLATAYDLPTTLEALNQLKSRPVIYL